MQLADFSLKAGVHGTLNKKLPTMKKTDVAVLCVTSVA